MKKQAAKKAAKKTAKKRGEVTAVFSTSMDVKALEKLKKHSQKTGVKQNRILENLINQNCK